MGTKEQSQPIENFMSEEDLAELEEYYHERKVALNYHKLGTVIAEWHPANVDGYANMKICLTTEFGNFVVRGGNWHGFLNMLNEAEEVAKKVLYPAIAEEGLTL